MKSKILSTVMFCITMMLSTSCVQSQGTFKQSLNDDWQIQSSEVATDKGEQISTVNYQTEGWISTSVPSTVMNALVESGKYPDIFMGKNLDKIDSKQFQCPWWYRKTFTLDEVSYQSARLIFEGLNYKANIWLNGKLIADSKQIEGAFNMFDLEVKKHLIKGVNTLAIEIIPMKYGDLTIGFVDWNPPAPDRNMGLWRGVSLKLSGAASLDEVYVKTDVDTETLNKASLSISSVLKNNTDKAISAKLVGRIGDINFSQSYTIEANSQLNANLDESTVKELLINKPKLWWPNNMGEPNLYTLDLELFVDGKKSDEQSVRFGIRELEEFKTADGHKGWKINGEKVMLRSGGWVDDLFLGDSDEKVAAQLDYVKHMNMNSIRLEGFWGKNKTIYDKADENGILILIGWSCEWEWESYTGRKEQRYMNIETPDDIRVQTKGYQDQAIWLRNHPSVFLWVLGSDRMVSPEVETKMHDILTKYDGTRPILSTCRGHVIGNPEPEISEITGEAGVKMRGPYSYVTPNYWYIDKEFGGAYGFNTETGPGAQVPPLESIKKMIPEDALWPPTNEMWMYHNGRHSFHTLDRYLTAFNGRYGESNNIEDFALLAQANNYEAMRAMFEAFSVNKHDEATGVVQWMLNSAWPETFWQLYDWYMMPNGAFYGTRAANQPLNLIYNYGDNNIYINNDHLKAFDGLKANIQILDSNSKEVFSKEVSCDVTANSSALVFELPEIKNLTSLYFVALTLNDESEKEISRNFYWLSNKKDVMDWDKTTWIHTPNKSFADLSELRTLPRAEVSVSNNFINDKGEAEVTLTNQSDKLAFLIELAFVDKESKLTLLPAFWSDNYLSLLPGETRVVKYTPGTNTNSDELELKVKGYNVDVK
ncbi:glycosyl hydrolase 2 galactose-binding domain-containing protein [Carboxylicivirga sp. N1Y90]|uniref:glycosyl hydrolase 2 galactose-binding domain-containing protein n=1 Tax=Carboxylicivirga fragile TaxID=3417571 RepID=UPI003D3299E9|nr:hypothetical protein [Marinilabiliaceae bacterium N1Y90]